MAAVNGRSLQRRLRGPLGLGLAFALSVFAGLIAWAALPADQLTFTLFQPDSKDLLNRLVAGSQLSVVRVGSVAKMQLDGPQPDAAMATYEVAKGEHAILDAMTRACRAEGLGPADDAHQGPDFNALCGGAWRGWDATVVVTNRCTSTCRMSVDVLAYPRSR